MNPQAQLEDLVAMYVEGRCGPDELKALEALLLADPGDRDDFLETVLLAQDLGVLRGQQPLKPGKSVVPVEIVLARQRKRAVRASMLAAAALILISAAALWLFMVPPHTATLASFRVAPDSAFVLTHAGDGEAPAGKVLHAGSRMVIEHGVVELELPHEVRAVVEAPAAVTLVDERTLQFEHGRAFFEVSSVKGRGFTVVTPRQRIVDLGTAFGVDKKVGRNEVELHVLEGRVRIDPLGGEEGEILKATRSVLLAGTRVREELDGPPADFRRELPPKVETLLDEDFESGLLGGREYAVVMDPTAVRDPAGNRFAGITDDHPWSFRTARPEMASVSFHDLGGAPSPGHVTTQRSLDETVDLIHFADGADTGIDFTIQGATGIYQRKETRAPAAGTPAAGLFLPSGIDLDDGFVAESEHESPGPAAFRFAGLDPTLRYDIALYGDRSGLPADGRERFTLQGAEAAANRSSTGIVGTFVTEMETRPNASAGHVVRWTGIDPGRDGSVSIEIDPSVSGHTNLAYLSAVRMAVTTAGGLPVDFNRLPFDGTDPVDDDDVVEEAGPATETGPPTAPDLEEMEGLAEPGRDRTPPAIISRLPAQNSSAATPGDRLTLTFDEPVELGTGRIFFRIVTDWRETEIAVGGRRTSVEGRVLTIIPPADLADGEVHFERISGWECQGRVGIFNPGEDGPWYAHEDLNDDSRGRGVIGSMRGPTLATFGECRPGDGIRREFGTIGPDSRYTVSAAIGVRAGESSAGKAFDGYAIRLTSGDTVLAELSDDTPPGPPDSVTNVGFSWDSSDLPAGVGVGEPLTLEITPNQASGEAPGYLDIDNLRVTVVGK